MLFNTSIAATVGSAGNMTAITNDALRSMQPDMAGNLRVDQAWGSAQIMAALHNASAGYYTNFPGLAGGCRRCYRCAHQVFGHPGEAWGYAVGAGAKFVNFLLPKDMIEFQVNYCHGAMAYCAIDGLYTQNFMYGGGNTIAMGWAADGVFNNGGQIQLTDFFSYAVGYQHYWNPQWRTSLVGGQMYTFVQQQRPSRAVRNGSRVGASGRGRLAVWRVHPDTGFVNG